MTEFPPTSSTTPSEKDAVLRAALRKASLRIFPLLALGYAIAFMDRVNISFASLQMNRDLHFSATVYGFGAGLFFVAYAACELPSNLLLYRFGARRWIARIMITWGLFAVAMIFVRTPLEFYIVRFMLGIAEAGFFPGAIFYIMQWFPQEMRARAVARFYVAIPLSTALMGAVAGGLLHLNGRLALKGWQWLFLVEALPAILLGITLLLLLPNGPADAAWLTISEREAILERIPPSSPQTHSIAPALRDKRVLLMGFFMFFVLGSSYAYIFTAPAIVQKLTGFSVTRVGFLIALINIAGAFAMIAGSALTDRFRRPFAFIITGCLTMLLGFLIFGTTTTPIFALSAVAMLYLGNYFMQGPIWAVGTSLFSGRAAAAAIAAINSIGILGGFVAPYWVGFAKDLTGNYQRGLLVMALPMFFAAAIMLYLSRQARQNSATSSSVIL